MNQRIKMIREEANLTQDEFADRIGIGKSSVSKLEVGTNNPSEQTIRAICKEFNVTREWLETGKGPMHEVVSEDDFNAINKVIRQGKENKVRLFRIIADMDDELLDKMIEYLQSKLKDLP